MHKIDGVGHLNNFFAVEDLNTNRPPTEITADWLNAVQSELQSAIEGAGIPLNKAFNNQLQTAINKLIADKYALLATPPIFDADLNIATTEFVQRALGNLNGCFFISDATVNLTLQHVGSFVTLGGQDQNCYLPILSSVPDGASIVISNHSGFRKEIYVSSPDDAISPNGTRLESITLVRGETITFTKETVWRATGNGVLKYMNIFSSLLSPNGYKFTTALTSPTGYLIEQWAYGSPQSTAGNQVINFPIAFPNAHLMTMVSSQYTSPPQSGDFAFLSATNTAVTVVRSNVDNTKNVIPLIRSIGY